MRSRTHLILVPMVLFAACQGDPQPTAAAPWSRMGATTNSWC